MSKNDDYRDLDFSDDGPAHRQTRRKAKVAYDKPRKKLTVDTADFIDDDDYDYGLYDDWRDGLGHQFRSGDSY